MDDTQWLPASLQWPAQPAIYTLWGWLSDGLQDTFRARVSHSGSATGLWSRDSSMSVSMVTSAPQGFGVEKREVKQANSMGFITF